MSLLAKVPALSALALVLSSFSFASTPHPTQTTKMLSSSMMQMPAVAPLFIEDGDFSSVLILVNSTSIYTYADITVHDLNGATVAMKRVEFAPHSQRNVDLGDLLSDAGSSDVIMGSITVMQSPTLSPMSIAAAVAMTQESSSGAHYIDEELMMVGTTGSQTLRAIAESEDEAPIVALTSLSTAEQHIAVKCLTASGPSRYFSLTLGPQQTLLYNPCIPETITDASLNEYSPTGDRRPIGPVGIELISDGTPGSFAAFALSRSHSGEHRFFSAVSFEDPAMLMSTTTVFTGVPVGQVAQLQPGDYAPIISLANFSHRPIQAAIHIAQTIDGASQLRNLDTISVPPLSSIQVPISQLRQTNSLQNSFEVVGTGAPGQLVATLVAKSPSQFGEVEMLGKDPMSGENGGNHPWSVANGTESTLLLYNTAVTSSYFNVSINGGGHTWQKAFTLVAHATLALSIGDIMTNRLKDDHGQTLPVGTQSGEVHWYVSSRNSGRGRLMQTDQSTGMARSFSCGVDILLCGINFSGQTSYFTLDGVYYFGAINTKVCENSCSGTPVGSGGGFTYGWSSQNAAIASLSGSTSGSTSSIAANKVGSTYINSWASDSYGCYESQTAPAAVVPTVDISGSSTLPLAAPNTAGAINTATLMATGSPSGGTYKWSIVSGTAVSLSATTGQSVTLTSTQAGTANVEVTYTLNGQQASQIQVETVQQPTSQSVYVDTGTQQNVDCNSSYGIAYTGDQRSVTYETLDQNGEQIPNSGMPATETFSNATGTCGVLPSPKNGSTVSGGAWTDHFLLCSSQCLPASSSGAPLGSCTVTATHKWYINGFVVLNHTLTYTCTSINP